MSGSIRLNILKITGTVEPCKLGFEDTIKSFSQDTLSTDWMIYQATMFDSNELIGPENIQSTNMHKEFKPSLQPWPWRQPFKLFAQNSTSWCISMSNFVAKCSAVQKAWNIFVLIIWTLPVTVPVNSPSCGGDVVVELAHSFLFYSCVSFSLYGSFNCISFHRFSRQLSAFSVCSSSLNSVLLVLLPIYLLVKVSRSPDIILCGWLGVKHQLPHSLWLTGLKAPTN